MAATNFAAMEGLTGSRYAALAVRAGIWQLRCVRGGGAGWHGGGRARYQGHARHLQFHPALACRRAGASVTDALTPPWLVAIAAFAGTTSCAPKPPVLPYLTVWSYPDCCGYDWERGAAFLSDVPKLAARRDEPREALIVFLIEPVLEKCSRPAREMAKKLGFRKTYFVFTARPALNDGAMLP